MPRRTIALLVAAFAVAGVVAPASPAEAGNARFVNPFIGTLGSGFVFPGPAAPYGMVQLSPDTEGYFAYTGYLYSDSFIRGFSHVRVQSMGVPEGGEIPMMPTVGRVLSGDVKRYQSKFDHANEHAEPGYYRVLLETYGIDAELTAGLRVGMHRYTFPPVDQANVLIDVGRHIAGGPTDDVQRTPGAIVSDATLVAPDTVVGSVNTALDGGRQAYEVHFAVRFDRPVARTGRWANRAATVEHGPSAASGRGAGLYVSFDAREDRDVVAKVGISFTSIDGALRNLEHELPGDDFDFDALRARTRAAWDQALSVIDVTGGTVADRTSFYTALYHAQHHPNVFEDADGSYLGHDGSIHSIADPSDPAFGARHYYANYSLWDTYRAEKPLLMTIAPERFADFMRSWNAIVEQGARLPRWSLMNRHADFMNGEPALQVFADAYCRGLVPADVVGDLYTNARALALDPVRHRNPDFLTRGWTDPSATLEHALGQFALALVADRLAASDPSFGADRDALLANARRWRNVFDGSIGFVRPRNADGSWRGNPYLPEDSAGFTEGTGWQYTWLVPHDVAGLLEAIGRDRAQERLDVFFSTALNATVPLAPAEAQQKITAYGIAYYGNQYAPSNEHDLQAPWLYDWTHEPWKTQAIQRAYQGLYRAAPDGLPGNDDLGTMSAWYVWSALGVYPMIPGAPVYAIGSPVFEHAVIRSGGDAFVIEAPGASVAAKYVHAAAAGGAPLDRTFVTESELRSGLRFDMSVSPNLSWPSAGAPLPPSMSADALSAFACGAS